MLPVGVLEVITLTCGSVLYVTSLLPPFSSRSCWSWSYSFLPFFFTVLSIVALAKLLNLLIRQEKHLFREEEIFLGN